VSGTLALALADARAGGKAQGLARLIAAGIRVPEGFCTFSECSDQELLQAWRQLKALRVAVRSSSLLEDSLNQSFAGQFETVLGVQEEKQLVQAVRRIQGSLTGSVIVQSMVDAQVAGVVFTRDPVSLNSCLRIEAAPGLGEAVVSGKARPSAWRLTLEGQITHLDGPQCLAEEQLLELLETTRRVQQSLEGELDLEFAYDSLGTLWILQARPITASHALRQQLRQQEIERARSLAEPGGTAWSRANVGETLPHPLPMTWSIVQHMTSLQGAYGRLYRDLGYDPDPSLEEIGVTDLLCGRPYQNLSRNARMFFRDLPFVCDLQAIRQAQDRSTQIPPKLDLSRARPGFWLSLPRAILKTMRAMVVLAREKRKFARRLTQQIAPALLARLESWRAQDLSELSLAELKQRLQEVIQVVAVDFAGESLKASAFAFLELSQHQGKPMPKIRPLAEADQAQWLRRAATGEIAFEQLLDAIGHRGPAEMELAEPRWIEVPERLRAQLKFITPGGCQPGEKGPEGTLAHWMSLRETARHWLMLGWAELRRTLLALDRELGLEGDIFWLHRQEIDNPDRSLIAQRKLHHRILKSLPCPTTLFSDDLEALGRATPVKDPGNSLQGTSLSWGSAQGPALVVQQVGEIPAQARDYVLVCPSTDPGYTLAMTRAVALVVETGGVLSHGAIVARELGLPAVSNIAIHEIQNGETVRVDGESGLVSRL